MSKLKKFRSDLNLSQIEFADITGVARHRIQIAEAGIPILRPQEIRRVAKIVAPDSPVPDWLLLLEISDDAE
jgi:transcriptional regulator with XRE-family HTH domain